MRFDLTVSQGADVQQPQVVAVPLRRMAAAAGARVRVDSWQTTAASGSLRN